MYSNNKYKILAILQARTSSSRLPGKVLKPVMGAPMLARQIERIMRSAAINRLVVATSTEADDDPIETLCAPLGVDCFRGSLNDVLDRFYHAAKPYAPDHVVRLTGDCPLIDPLVIDRVIAFHLGGSFDYTSNTVEPTFPDGLDVELMTYACLTAAWREAALPSQREHVTSFIYQHPERFRIGSYRQPQDHSAQRWTVDEPEDFELVSRIYAALYPVNPSFTTADILELLEHDRILQSINAGHLRNAGYAASLLNDMPIPPDKEQPHGKDNKLQ